ncbi:glucose-6-phosphate isomerase [Maritimibacter sp. 55A14]|uniref:glucose-6-phosphate isomerase n=1 Tax=Maritimibacter sp. 55A14 TaxID=2174844 RepID=UPI000D608CD1|nr:glucose-6-phosphate isomerase [Maritimibacter sp. 55A14]PWE34215.1 glucose-6-phosphate isomerase [Maritimibacter sp. 55A14]
MPDWSELKRLAAARRPIAALFAADPDRAAGFSARADGLLFDYSKTAIDADIRAALLDLARQAGLAARRAAMFSGAPINETEGRAVLHTALRNPEGGPVEPDGADVMPGVRRALARMRDFACDLRAGRFTAPGGARIRHVVNIGIGGSDLGPAMAVRALSPYGDGPEVHFVSNVDGAHIADVLARVDLARTLFVVVSKSFTTVETMTNAATARARLEAALGAEAAPGHFAAVSTAQARTAEFGIPPERVFGFADWVGGRYSLWGPVGLSLMLAIGPERFAEFLAGGASMDTHFRETSAERNLPVLLALTGIWHNQICGHATRAVLPYEQRLELLPAYLQQLEMESNGKSVAMDGNPVRRDTGPVVWGQAGTNGQHAFYQLLHQGSRVVPCEFLAGAEGHEPDLAGHHRLLLANCLAQSQALMQGRSLEEARRRMAAAGYEGTELERQARHRVFPGDRPSVTLLYPRLAPFVLGQIVALYEHRVFVEGVILGINSFDQWGVELGKEMATALEPLLEDGETGAEGQDGSTRQLLDYIRGHRS